ncbi:MAG: NAD-dependent epimerase/dehydratase family protein [Chitinophagaceae bacterium]
MKVLVTGATGFIGNYVIGELLTRGIAVIATSTHIDKAKQKDWYDKVTYIPHTIGEETNQDLFTKFRQPDMLIHLAWKGLPNYKDLFHFEENLLPQYFFLKNLIENGLNDITITGTCYEYGMINGCLAEDMVADPANSYAIAKNSLRLFLEMLQKKQSFSLKWMRLFYMYGEGQSPNSLLEQLKKAIEHSEEVFNMSGGEQVRDYLPVEKVAANIVSAALQNETTGIINCCSNQPVTVKQLVTNYLAKTGKSIKLNTGYYPYPDFEPMEFWGDDNKLKTIIKHE